MRTKTPEPGTANPQIGYRELLVWQRQLYEHTAVQAVNECLGYHDCDLCPGELPADQQTWRRPGHLRACIGNGEIRVPARPGTAFAAPRLIGHYVLDHSYQPPQDFIDAVLTFDLDCLSTPAWARFPWIPADAEILDE